MKAEDNAIEIKHERFLGLDNLSDPTRLRSDVGSRQVTALNCSIRPDYTIERRKGYELVTSADFRDIWASGDVMLAVKDNNLVRVTDYAATVQYETLWYGVGGRKFAYADTGNGIYLTEGTVLKVFRSGSLSDVPGTTEDFKIKTPAGSILEYHKGRLYVVVDNLIYITDVANCDVVDMRTGIKPMPSDVRMVKSLKTGLWVSDSHKTYFFRDIQAVADVPFDMKMFAHSMVFDYPAVKGTGRKVTNILTQLQKYDEAIMWTSEQGVCIGGDGVAENLTESRWNLTSVMEGVDIYSKTGGLHQYITMLKTRR